MPRRPLRSDSVIKAKFPRQFSRIVINTHDRDLTPEQLNQLWLRAGLSQRDPDKWAVALEHSLLCLTARILQNQALVGFVRVSGDGVFNATIWDFVVDPTQTDPRATKTLLLERLKRQIRRSIPQCSVSIFANPQDSSLLKGADFAEDATGIRGMIWRESRFSRITLT